MDTAEEDNVKALTELFKRKVTVPLTIQVDKRLAGFPRLGEIIETAVQAAIVLKGKPSKGDIRRSVASTLEPLNVLTDVTFHPKRGFRVRVTKRFADE